MRNKWLLVVAAFLTVSSSLAQKVTVVTEEYPPYNYMNEHKKVSGVATDIVEEVLKRAKIDYELNLYPWARAYQMAQDAPNVLIYSIGRNEKRENLFKWVEPIVPYNVYFYRLKNREDIVASDLAGIKKYKIGAVRDDVGAQFLDKEGIKGVDLVPDFGTNAKKLAAGRIEVFTMDELGAIALYKREGLDFNSIARVFKVDALSAGMYMAFSKQTSDDLVNKCKAALADMKKDGTMEKIRVKYSK